MKSIKNKPKLCKGKIVNKLYCILLTTLELIDYIFFRKKNRHEVHYLSLLKKKEYIKKNCQNTIRPKKDTKLCLRVEKWSRSVQHLFLFSHKAC